VGLGVEGWTGHCGYVAFLLFDESLMYGACGK
jgi:hypothetical protein